MLSLKKILAPIDFSETSMHSLDYAVDLANKVGAAVVVVHVYQIPLYSFPDGVLVAPAELAADLSARAQRHLDACLEVAGPLALLLVEREHRGEVGVGRRAAKRATNQRRDDLPGAGAFIRG